MSSESPQKYYKGRGWRFVDLRKLSDTPEPITAFITVFGFLVVAGLLGALSWRVFSSLVDAKADDLNKYLLAIAGVLGAPFVAWRTIVAHQQTSIARESHYTSLFTKAVEQLGATREVKEWAPGHDDIHGEVQTRTQHNLEVRLGAIYALDRIAKDSERDHWPIMEVLCAYARNAENCGVPVSAPPEAKDTDWAYSSAMRNPRVDIQAAVTVIGSRSTDRIAHENERNLRPDFSRANLQLVVLTGDFKGALFSESDLTRASFNCPVSGADFYGATLRAVFVSKANWEKTRLGWSKIHSANFNATNLSGSIFSWCSMEDTGFSNCDLSSTRFSGVKMNGGSFIQCDLRNASLHNAEFTKVDFTETKFDGAALYRVNLSTCTGITTAQLETAFGDASTKLPAELERPKSWPETVVRPRDWKRIKAT